MRKLVLLMVVVGWAVAGCATPRIAGQCPEAAKLRCLTSKQCSWDDKRGCQVCRCAAPGDTDAPDRRPTTP